MPDVVLRPDLVTYFRDSVKLKDPTVELDSQYKYTDAQLEEILKKVCKTLGYSIVTLPETEEQAVNILAMQELFWKLASATAPLYPITAEGINIQKNIRFDHYLQLIRECATQYAKLKEAQALSGTNIQVGQVLIERDKYKRRNYNLRDIPSIRLFADTMYMDKAEISWTPVLSGDFLWYNIYLNTVPNLDIYEEGTIKENSTLLAHFLDPNVIRYRVKDLLPSTDYYILLEAELRGRVKAYNELKVTTLAIGGVV